MIDRAALELAWKGRVASETDTTQNSPLDALLPPLHHLLSSPASDADGIVVTQADDPHQITIVAYLDRSNPLTEARWVKTGEVEAWITSLGIDSKTDVVSEWKGKISVSDPDPVSLVSFPLRLESVADCCRTLQPPTIQHALDTWASTSLLGSVEERNTFVAGHLSNIDNGAPSLPPWPL